MTNSMREIRIGKITLNIGAGKDQSKLDKGVKLIKNMTGIEPVKTVTSKRVPEWGLRPGLPIGCKLTLRGEEYNDLLKRLIEGKDNILRESNFDNAGNISFGISEYIDIPGVAYDPEIGVMGLQICVTLERPGFRIKKRRIKAKKIPKTQSITREDAIKFMKDNFQIKLSEEE